MVLFCKRLPLFLLSSASRVVFVARDRYATSITRARANAGNRIVCRQQFFARPATCGAPSETQHPQQSWTLPNEPIAKLSGNVAQSPSAVFNLPYFQCFFYTTFPAEGGQATFLQLTLTTVRVESLARPLGRHIQIRKGLLQDLLHKRGSNDAAVISFMSVRPVD